MSFSIFNISEEGYLRDESRKSGRADSISFPSDKEEISRTMAYLSRNRIKTTIQGARTGITAGAVPCGGHILNLEKMNKIIGMRYLEDKGTYIMNVQPGAILSDIRKYIASETSGRFFFPPDPTETTATIGGMTACNASGARSYRYGPVRKYIEGLHIILADGSPIYLRRGGKAWGFGFLIQTGGGKIIEGRLPTYRMPDVKNASGYYTAENMDLVDLFIGSEGTLGIIAEIEIRLIKKPLLNWGMMLFFPEEHGAIRFVRTLRGDFGDGFVNVRPDDETSLSAIEYFNRAALDLIRPHDEKNTAIYIEIDGNDEQNMIDSMLEVSSMAETCGGKEEDTWIASGDESLEKMKKFRHSVPETVNTMIDGMRRNTPELTKLGTDMAVPDDRLEQTMAMYNSDTKLLGVDPIMFGHIGDNHVHVNVVADSPGKSDEVKAMYLRWAREVVNNGGTVSAEHGIGKLKVEFLNVMFGLEGINQMKAVKKQFDPDNILNPGNLFGSGGQT